MTNFNKTFQLIGNCAERGAMTGSWAPVAPDGLDAKYDGFIPVEAAVARMPVLSRRVRCHLGLKFEIMRQ